MITRQGTQRKSADNTTASTSIDWPKSLRRKGPRLFQREHIHLQRRHAPTSVLHCLIVDCSASMLLGENLSRAKTLLLHWSQTLYRQRAKLCVIAFSGHQARVLQSPCKASGFNEHWIEPITGGGGTPVESSLTTAANLLRATRMKSPEQKIGLWLLTDGRFKSLPARPAHANFCTVVDFEDNAVPLRRALKLSQSWKADYLHAAQMLP